MRAGGIHDHLGGGFHRYSTDRDWLVPHFEKMLYDQAQIAWAYLEAYQVTRNAAYAAPRAASSLRGARSLVARGRLRLRRGRRQRGRGGQVLRLDAGRDRGGARREDARCSRTATA
jgi:hypothetical protein